MNEMKVSVRRSHGIGGCKGQKDITPNRHQLLGVRSHITWDWEYTTCGEIRNIKPWLGCLTLTIKEVWSWLPPCRNQATYLSLIMVSF